MRIKILDNGFDIMENLAYCNRKIAAREQGEYLICLATGFFRRGALSGHELWDYVNRTENFLNDCGCPVLKNYEISKDGESIGYYRMAEADREIFANSPFNRSEICEVA